MRFSLNRNLYKRPSYTQTVFSLFLLVDLSAVDACTAFTAERRIASQRCSTVPAASYDDLLFLFFSLSSEKINETVECIIGFRIRIAPFSEDTVAESVYLEKQRQEEECSDTPPSFFSERMRQIQYNTEIQIDENNNDKSDLNRQEYDPVTEFHIKH